MKDGYIRVASSTPSLKIANCEYNADKIIELVNDMDKKDINVLVLPELCLTGATCADLFFQNTLINNAHENLRRIANKTKNTDVLFTVGLPIKTQNRLKLLNSVAVIFKGEVICIVYKSDLSADERRYFSSSCSEKSYILDNQKHTCLFTSDETSVHFENLHAEIGIYIGNPVSLNSECETLVKSGVSIILNPCSLRHSTGDYNKRMNIIKAISEKLSCGYVSANSGISESTTDYLYSGGNFIAECGEISAFTEDFSESCCYTDLDLEIIEKQRIKRDDFSSGENENYSRYWYTYPEKDLNLVRHISKTPYMSEDTEVFNSECEDMLKTQSYSLAKRLKHIHCKNTVVGLSGGLDSTLALIATVNAYDILGLPHDGILAVTMPCFGTTSRTRNNATLLSEAYDTDFMQIDIKNSVLSHFSDIGQDWNSHDVTYENAQARERTQVLMDIANQKNGIVIGTGDMSEMALGWATYNGDHMSMYGVNGGIMKSQVRSLVKYTANNAGNKKLQEVLYDILDTPVSPELLPPSDSGEISQVTEDLVGPYELHDFFLYYIMKYGFTPKKIFRLAKIAFEGTYDDETIKKWLNTFTRRFTNQQFKRSCMPDGICIGNIGLSPRGALKMPSDADTSMWKL